MIESNKGSGLVIFLLIIIVILVVVIIWGSGKLTGNVIFSPNQENKQSNNPPSQEKKQEENLKSIAYELEQRVKAKIFENRYPISEVDVEIYPSLNILVIALTPSYNLREDQENIIGEDITKTLCYIVKETQEFKCDLIGHDTEANMLYLHLKRK